MRFLGQIDRHDVLFMAGIFLLSAALYQADPRLAIGFVGLVLTALGLIGAVR